MDDRIRQTTLHTTEEANHFARDFTERTERAGNMIANQADTVLQMWKASADIVSGYTTRSADQAARTLGISETESEKAAGLASGSVGALVQSASVVTDAAQAVSTELVELLRHATERSIDHIGAMTRCRSPEDFVTAQTDAVRDNVEMLIDSSRRIGEIALRTAEESSHVIGRNLKPIKRSD